MLGSGAHVAEVTLEERGDVPEDNRMRRRKTKCYFGEARVGGTTDGCTERKEQHEKRY